jgi:S1-C subfamily serine protease
MEDTTQKRALTAMSDQTRIPLLSKDVPLSPPDAAAQVQDAALRKMYEDVNPAVVQLKTDKGTGSGFFINDHGEILTAAHVVLNARETFAVTMNGKAYRARIVDISDTTDLARLQLEEFDGSKQPYLKLADDSKMAPDQPVYSIGYPKGFSTAYLSPGDYNAHVTIYDLVDKNAIAAKFKSANSLEKDNWLKALSGKVIEGDVHVERGNSGGPLLNSEGKVIGVADIASRDGVSISYYRPVEDVRSFLKQEREKPFTITYTHVRSAPGSFCIAGLPPLPSEATPPKAQQSDVSCPARDRLVLEEIRRNDGLLIPPFDWTSVTFRPTKSPK